jgi:hypothetical protein
MGASDLDLWHVQVVGPGNATVIRTMTLDELDAAFQAGVIGERTLVLQAGALRWTTLADAAGLGAADVAPPPARIPAPAPQPAASPTPAPASVSPNSIAPFAVDVAPARMAMPSPYTPSFGASFGEELEGIRPKRGRTVAAFAAIALVCGGVFVASTHGAELRDKASWVSSAAKGGSDSARSVAVAPPPAAEPLPPPASFAPPMANAKPVEASAPQVTPTTSSSKTKKGAEKKGKGPRVKPGAEDGTPAKPENADATVRGSTHQYDPLNGAL